MKICSKCGIEKDLNDFYKRKDTKDGLRSDCKECKDLVSKKYHENHKEEIDLYQKNYKVENEEKIKENNRINYDINKKEIREKIRNDYV